MKGAGIAAVVLLVAGTRLAAQDSVNVIRLGVRGAPQSQPGLAVVSGPGLDSVRAIVRRDLENSNRFTMPPHGADADGVMRGPIDANAFKGSGLTWLVELQPAINGVEVKLYDVATGLIRQRATMAADIGGVGDSRLTIHRVSDQVVGWIGGVGIAATRIVFKEREGKDGGIWRIDSDGANMARVSRGGITMTPAWSPDGSSVAYSEFRDGRWTLYLQKLATSSRVAVPSSAPGDSYGAAFAPDGKTLAYAHGLERGAAIESVDISRMCCAHELTHDKRFADNVAPTYSPDGRRIAYMSTRTGTPELYVMDDDGTGAQQLVSSEFEDNGRALATYTPAWSPDGVRVVFARDTRSGARHLYSVSVGSGQVVQLTSSGRNQDPSWAPDGRHVVFKSDRGGRDQLWILDIESGMLRQISTPGSVQYPAWSRVLGNNP